MPALPVDGLTIAKLAARALNTLGDVSAPSPTRGDVLSWDGSAWVPTSASAPGAHALVSGTHTVAGLTAGHVLTALTGTTFGFAALPAGAAHALLSVTHSDVTAGTVARGDLITGQGASPTWARLAKGAAGYFFKMDGSGVDAGWAAHGLTYSDVGAAASGHTHAGVYLPVAGTAADSDKLDGNHGSYYAVAGAAPAVHQLIDSTGHYADGLTAGHFLKALSATTYAFAAHGLTYSDVGAAASGHNHSGTYDPAGTGHTEAAAHVSAHESTYNHANYNTAYGWGNHASAGYFVNGGALSATTGAFSGALTTTGGYADIQRAAADPYLMFTRTGGGAQTGYWQLGPSKVMTTDCGVSMYGLSATTGTFSGNVTALTVGYGVNMTDVPQLLIGSNYQASIGGRYAGGDLVIANNALQDSNVADHWIQATGSHSSWLVRMGLDGHFNIYHAAAGRTAGTMSAFWASEVFNLTPAGALTLAAGLAATTGVFTGAGVGVVYNVADGATAFDVNDVSGHTGYLMTLRHNSANKVRATTAGDLYLAGDFGVDGIITADGGVQRSIQSANRPAAFVIVSSSDPSGSAPDGTLWIKV